MAQKQEPPKGKKEKKKPSRSGVLSAHPIARSPYQRLSNMKPAPDVNPPSKNGRSKYFRPQKCIDAIRSSTTPATTQMNLGVLALFIKNYAGDLPLDLSGLDLSGLYLPHANLTGANLARTKFIGATLDGADFTGATLTDAIFKNAYLKDAIFPREHADLLSDDQKRQIKEWA